MYAAIERLVTCSENAAKPIGTAYICLPDADDLQHAPELFDLLFVLAVELFAIVQLLEDQLGAGALDARGRPSEKSAGL
jgi:hypothetical protein